MRISIAKKGLTMLLSLLLILSTGSLAFASDPMGIGADGSMLSPSLNDVNPINDVYYQSSASYIQNFSVNPSDGNNLNIYVENLNDSAATVDATVHFPDGSSHTVTLSQGQHYVWTDSDPNGVSGTYKVVVSESTGNVMHIHVNARQFSLTKNLP